MTSSSSASEQTPWWLLAAAAMAFLATGMYAWSLRAQLLAARETAAQATNEAQSTRVDLSTVRRESGRLGQALAVLTAPDVARIELTGPAAAAGPAGRAHWSRSRGLVFDADRLPPLAAGRVYQLWALTPTPISIGILAVSADGNAMIAATADAGLTHVVGFEVTNEPGPKGSGAPTGPALLVGAIKSLTKD
jgi:hypothetical protein